MPRRPHHSLLAASGLIFLGSVFWQRSPYRALPIPESPFSGKCREFFVPVCVPVPVPDLGAVPH